MVLFLFGFLPETLHEPHDERWPLSGFVWLGSTSSRNPPWPLFESSSSFCSCRIHHPLLDLERSCRWRGVLFPLPPTAAIGNVMPSSSSCWRDTANSYFPHSRSKRGSATAAAKRCRFEELFDVLLLKLFNQRGMFLLRDGRSLRHLSQFALVMLDRCFIDRCLLRHCIGQCVHLCL
jgi:hypothetical protein